MLVAETQIAHRDQTGTGMITGGRTESQPPWNTAAAYALLIPHAGVRQLEHDVRLQITGTVVERGGSAANTAGAIRYLIASASALTEHEVAEIAALMERWSALAFALPSVERLPQWVPDFMDGQPDPDCPWCGTGNLRYNDVYGVVACLKPACPGEKNGTRLHASVIRGHGGRVVLAWVDGTRQTSDRTIGPSAHDPARRSRIPAPPGDRQPAAADHRPTTRPEPDQQPGIRRAAG